MFTWPGLYSNSCDTDHDAGSPTGPRHDGGDFYGTDLMPIRLSDPWKGFWALLPMLLCIASSARADFDYQMGHGLDIGDFNIGGYANLVAGAPQGQGKYLTIDDLSLFVTGHVNRYVNPLVEMELAVQPLFRGSISSPTPDNSNVLVERIYNDSYLSDQFTLRLGKMLAPVGEWNLIHAAPLVLTSIRPLVTERGFSDYVSGASLLYADAADEWPDIQAYWQPSEDIAVRPKALTSRRYQDIEGLHVNWPIGLTDKIGFSFQRSRVVDSSEEQFVYGANVKYSFYRFTVDAEATLNAVSGGDRAVYRRTEGGAYVLGSYALTEHWSAFAWYEQYADREIKAQARDALFGVDFKPDPSLILKIERVKNFSAGWGNPTGYFASLAVIF